MSGPTVVTLIQIGSDTHMAKTLEETFCGHPFGREERTTMVDRDAEELERENVLVCYACQKRAS